MKLCLYQLSNSINYVGITEFHLLKKYANLANIYANHIHTCSIFIFIFLLILVKIMCIFIILIYAYCLHFLHIFTLIDTMFSIIFVIHQQQDLLILLTG